MTGQAARSRDEPIREGVGDGDTWRSVLLGSNNSVLGLSYLSPARFASACSSDCSHPHQTGGIIPRCESGQGPVDVMPLSLSFGLVAATSASRCLPPSQPNKTSYYLLT